MEGLYFATRPAHVMLDGFWTRRITLGSGLNVRFSHICRPVVIMLGSFS